MVLWFLHAEFAPDVKPKYLGTVKKGELIKCDNFEFSVKTDYRGSAFLDSSAMYSYTLKGKEYTEKSDDICEYKSFNIGGIRDRQPFPKGAENRKIIFYQKVLKEDSSPIAVGYIAVGSELHNCDLSKGVLNSINLMKAYCFGNVDSISFVFKTDYSKP